MASPPVERNNPSTSFPTGSFNTGSAHNRPTKKVANSKCRHFTAERSHLPYYTFNALRPAATAAHPYANLHSR